MLKSLEKYGIIDFQDKIEAKKYLSFKLKKITFTGEDGGGSLC